MNLVFVLIMVSAGLLGGVINFYLNDDPESKHTVGNHMVIGIGASLLVPLFLNMISSKLMKEASSNPGLLLVFLGFCLIAAISSKAFISTISDRILNQAKEARRATAELQRDLDPILQQADESSETIDAEAINIANLNGQQHTVLAALHHPRYTYRTLGGISTGTKLNKTELKEVLVELDNQGLSGQVDRGNGPRFYITANGLKALTQQAQTEGEPQAG